MEALRTPLLFKPILKETLWGGCILRDRFHKYSEDKIIGESWEICGLSSNPSVILNGPYKGISIDVLIKQFPKGIIGNQLMEELPLLYKIIDASQWLSVQVHPNDAYAQVNENGKKGKAELWHILDAKEDAQIVIGLKPGIGKQEFKNACESNCIKESLNFVNVKKGESYFIPPGTVHAIGEGITIAEIQQSSDLTYRIYDWDRVDHEGKARELHLAKAFDVIDYESKPVKVEKSFKSRYFYISLQEITKTKRITTNDHTFNGLMVVEGDIEVVWSGGVMRMRAGQSVLIPAIIDSYHLKGRGRVILSEIPDIESAEELLA